MVTTAQTHKLDYRIDTDVRAHGGIVAALRVTWEPEPLGYRLRGQIGLEPTRRERAGQ
jgi:hypothetical protein